MQSTIDLLESILDLHLGETTIDEWLQRLASIEECASACVISWTAGKPDSVIFNYSSQRIAFQPDWIASMDHLITSAKPENPDLLKNIALRFGALNNDPEDPLNNPSLIISYLDSDPACTLIVLRCDNKTACWTEAGREHIKDILPVLLKAHRLHKRIAIFGHHLDIANKVLDGTPRGVITMTPTAGIIKANSMALDIINDSECFSEENGRFIVTSPRVSQQFDEKLAQIQAIPIEALKDFIWYRRFQNPEDDSTYQLAMRAFPIDNWHLQSSQSDRFVALFIHVSKLIIKPTAEQLRDVYDLTNKQAQLIRSLLDGNDIKTSAEKLCVSVHTIRSHLRSIYKKLGVSNKTDMLRVISTTLVSYTTNN